MALTARELHQAERAYRKAAERAELLRGTRNALVLRALLEGWTHQQISNATGLSRGRISQIKP